MNQLYKFRLVLLALLLGNAGWAQTTYYSRSGGTPPLNWDEADSWTLSADGSGPAAGVPGRNDNVVILSGHEIIVDATGDNGSAGTSPDALGRANVGPFTSSGATMFYQIGNITVNAGGTLTLSVRAMFDGTTLVLGTLNSTSDIVNLGRFEIANGATFNSGDDLILTGYSETLLFNTTTTDDDIYLDYTDALLCGDGIIDIGNNSPNTPDIQYFNGATINQICSSIQITGCTTCPVSGSGTFTLEPAQKLIAAGAVWKYLDDGTDQGTAWYGTGFNDSGWAAGRSELGYGDGDETTTVSYGPNSSSKFITTYFRKTFYVEDPTEFSSVLLRLVRDDGAVVYLNGTEVDRHNMPAGTITYTTTAASTVGGSSESTFFETTLATSVLVAGTNTIAVEIHQRSGSSSDISFNLELIGRYNNALIPKGAVWKYLDDGTDQGTAWYGTGYNDAAWASGPAQLGYGDGDEATVVSYGSNSSNKHITTYFRHSFTISDVNQYISFTLRVLRDDGAVVYVNGTEVTRQNMPAGTITYTTTASTAIGGADEDTFYEVDVSPSLFVTGTNLVAVEIHQAGPTSSDISFDLELVGNLASALPVEMILFNATPTDKGVLLEWATAVEKNNDFFRIENAREGLEFREIGRIPGSGTTDGLSYYRFVHANPQPGLHYYRLAQQDFDGSVTYSETIMVEVAERSPQISIWPNPAIGSVYVSADGDIRQIRLRNAQGQVVQAPVLAGEHYTIETGGLPAGIYLVDLIFLGYQQTRKLVIVNR